jgi:hypothetical protein
LRKAPRRGGGALAVREKGRRRLGRDRRIKKGGKEKGGSVLIPKWSSVHASGKRPAVPSVSEYMVMFQFNFPVIISLTDRHYHTCRLYSISFSSIFIYRPILT